MTTLFSAPGLLRLEQFVQPGLLCVFDFDGTLAPIVAVPDHASLPAEVARRLHALADLTQVAILTGRALPDIRGRLGFTPHYLIGNHGMEGLPDSARRTAEYRHLSRAWHQALTAALRDHSHFDAGIQIEDKQISLSVHYRSAGDSRATESRLLELFASLQPRPRVIPGKFVFNLLPDGAADKGSAMEELMRLSKASIALYAGDDVTDEDVFALRRADVLSIRIGKDIDSAAEFFIESQADIIHLLDELVFRLQGSGIRKT